MPAFRKCRLFSDWLIPAMQQSQQKEEAEEEEEEEEELAAITGIFSAFTFPAVLALAVLHPTDNNNIPQTAYHCLPPRKWKRVRS